MKSVNLAVALTAVGLLLVLTPACSTAAPDAPHTPTRASSPGRSAAREAVLGVFRGTERPIEVDRFEAWLGYRVGSVLDYVGVAEPGSGDPWLGIDRPGDRCRGWGHHRRHLVLSVAMLPSSEQTLRRGASGEYDDHWRSFGQELVANGCGAAVLRLGWEFNGRFFPWAAGGREVEFAAYWRRIVATLREVSGQSFTYEWGVLAGNANADVEAAYPGDDVVDLIGLDAYDTSALSVPEERWSDQLDRAYGLRWHATFAAAHEKRLAFSEWGLFVRPRDNLGGGDAPLYIERMIDWISTHDVAHAIYFDVDARDGTHRISTDRFPMASAVFRRRGVELAGPAVSGSRSGAARRPAPEPAEP
ncbi:MAG: glycoside hydrolase family 26 protein [Microthrixaceae bacterium]